MQLAYVLLRALRYRLFSVSAPFEHTPARPFAVCMQRIASASPHLL